MIIWEKTGSWRLEVNEAGQAAVRHPGAVVLLPLPTAETVLLLRQYRHALGQTIWELPAGTRGWEEDWLACAQRELREETGFQAAEFTHLGDVWPAPGISDELMRLYSAHHLTTAPLPPDADEEIEVVELPLAEARAMAADGRIRDGKTIIALSWWRGE